MKVMIGYTIWLKRDMLSYLMEGVTQSMDPKSTEVAFHFDTNTDGSLDAYHSMNEFLLGKRGFKAHWSFSAVEIRELGAHNALIDLFMNSDCDLLAVFQDDQRITRFPVQTLASLMEQFGPKLGLVGGRDGYESGFTKMASSEWSESVQPGQTRLAFGSFTRRPYMNSGPVIYTKHLIEKVGKIDTDFNAYYAWDDYGQRAINQGLHNCVVGTDLVHAKFGPVRATEWTDKSGVDLERLRQKHGLGII